MNENPESPKGVTYHPTMSLRWQRVGWWHQGQTIKVSTDRYIVLQQAFQGDDGSIQWQDVPTAEDDAP